MSAPQVVAVGQRWRSRDKRDHGKVVTVLRVDTDDTHADGFAEIQGLVRTRVRFSTLRSRYRLVSS